MNELIRTSSAIIGGEEQQTVNARELWERLESKQRFSDWFSNRVKDCGFTVNKDFCFVNLGSKDGRGGHNRKEYWITLDVAKHLAMLERNEQGRKIRDYFIEVEKNARKFSETVSSHVAAVIPVIRENERLRARLEFAIHFLPHGKPGELNENGEHKTQFRRGYYTAGKGRSVTALIERVEQPGLFDAVELKQLAGRIE